MAYTINENCIACGQCKPECPVEAISEGSPFIIDAEKCTSCGLCAAVCPTSAIDAD
jgi:NAD-dependent dihydropyrimidine dehydrogenase PreA subunit